MARTQFNVRVPDLTVQQVAELQELLPAESQAHVIILAIERLWQEERNRRQHCPDCGQEMSYYPGRPVWIHDDCPADED